jgi:hypothetical protein
LSINLRPDSKVGGIVLTNKPWKPNREETLALVCTLIITTFLCAYSLYLKLQETPEAIVVPLFEYDEAFNLPSRRQDLSKRFSGQTNRAATSPRRGTEPQVAEDSSWIAEHAPLHDSLSTSSPDSLAKASRKTSDSSRAEMGLAFRPYKPSRELDSIFAMGEAGVSLLREHLFHENRIYDTLLTNHLIRFKNEIARVDVSTNLESQAKFNVGRYGLPYNPLRPQPPSPQIQIK